MNEYIAWTTFADKACTEEQSRTEKRGLEARQHINIFQNLKGSEVKEGDIICGCRIDKIGVGDE